MTGNSETSGLETGTGDPCQAEISRSGTSDLRNLLCVSCQAVAVGVFLRLLPNLDPPTRPAGFSRRHSFPLLHAPCSRPSVRNAGQVGSTASLTEPLQPCATAPSG